MASPENRTRASAVGFDIKTTMLPIVVGCCDNDKRYPERMIVHSNVKDGKIVFHKQLVNEERQNGRIHAVSKGREDFEEPKHFKVAMFKLFPLGKAN